MKHLAKNFGILVLISQFSFITFSQEGDRNVKQKITDEKGNVTLLMFNDENKYKSSDYITLFKEQLGLDSKSEMVKITSDIDDLGITHERFQLYHKGVKVEFTTYNVHSKEGKVISMNGEMYVFKE
jgi:Zn-dependent metalloprotease